MIRPPHPPHRALAGSLALLAALAAACEAEPPAPSLRARLAATEARWEMLDEPARRLLLEAARAAPPGPDSALLDAQAPRSEPVALASLVAHAATLDEARQRQGLDTFAAGRFVRADDDTVRAEPCAAPLLPAPGAAPPLTVLEAPRVYGVALAASPPRLAERASAWLASCGAATGSAIELVVVPGAPFLAAWWPEQDVALLHPLAVELLALETPPAPAPQGRYATLAAPLHATLDGCIAEQRALCADCFDDPKAAACALPTADEDGANTTDCAEYVAHSAAFPWFETALCASVLAASVGDCPSCRDPAFEASCLLPQVTTDLYDAARLSPWRGLATLACRRTLDACLATDGACEPPPEHTLPEGFDACVAELRAICEQCIGATPDGPAACQPLFEDSTIEQDCVDLGFPDFEQISRPAMFCAWQSEARPSCLNARETCVRSEVAVVSFDTLVLGYGAFADERRRDACIDQVLACEANQGLAPLPESTDPPWREPPPPPAADDEGSTCGD